MEIAEATENAETVKSTEAAETTRTVENLNLRVSSPQRPPGLLRLLGPT